MIIRLAIMSRDQVVAERAEPARVAVRRRRIDRQRPAGQQLAEQVADEHVARGARQRHLLVVGLLVGALAGLHVPELAGLVEVAGVDDDAGRAAVARHAAEAVVELVDQLHVAHAEVVVDLVEAPVDVGVGAVADAVVQPAVEEVRDLDAGDDRELAGVDDAPRLERVGHDPEPALARAALLRVDVALQRAQVLGLQAHAVHLVAGVAPVRIQRAQRVVLDEEVHEDPLAAAATSAPASGSSSARGRACCSAATR